MDDFLRIENRHTGEILRMRRMRDAQGQIVLILDGSLPPQASGPPLHVHIHEHEEVIVKAGTVGALVGDGEDYRASRGNRNLSRRHSSSLVERGRRSVGA